MTNKHYCQGPTCHTRHTTDRFQKSTGKFRGRYASFKINQNSFNGNYNYMQLFCSQGCANAWLNHHTDNIINRRPINFITERRVGDGVYKIEKSQYGWNNFERVDSPE